MSKSNAVGTRLELGGVIVGGLKSINGISVSAESIDVTDLGNKDGYREKLPGFKDGGDVPVSGFLDGDDEGQDKFYELLNSGDVVDCKIIFPAKIGKTWSFKAGVTAFTTGAEVEDAVTFEGTLSVSGKPVLAKTAVLNVAASQQMPVAATDGKEG